MAIMKRSMLALALAGAVCAQSSIVTVFFPGADNQTMVGSVIASDKTKTTMAVGCPSNVDADACGFAESVTVTVGPSTFHAEESYATLAVTLDCKVTGTTEATCQETYVGPIGLIDSDIGTLTATDATFNTQLTTTAVTTALSRSDIAYIPITLTAFANSNATTGTSGSTSAASETGGSTTETAGSGSGASASGSASAAPTTASNNGAAKGDSRMLTVAAAGAGLMGLTIFLL